MAWATLRNRCVCVCGGAKKISETMFCITVFGYFHSSVGFSSVIPMTVETARGFQLTRVQRVVNIS